MVVFFMVDASPGSAYKEQGFIYRLRRKLPLPSQSLRRLMEVLPMKD